MAEPLLTIRGAYKHFGGVAALRGADLTVDAGEVHALLGENGAGKSTLLKTLAGVHRLDAGEIALERRSRSTRAAPGARSTRASRSSTRSRASSPT